MRRMLKTNAWYHFILRWRFNKFLRNSLLSDFRLIHVLNEILSVKNKGEVLMTKRKVLTFNGRQNLRFKVRTSRLLDASAAGQCGSEAEGIGEG